MKWFIGSTSFFFTFGFEFHVGVSYIIYEFKWLTIITLLYMFCFFKFRWRFVMSETWQWKWNFAGDQTGWHAVEVMCRPHKAIKMSPTLPNLCFFVWDPLHMVQLVPFTTSDILLIHSKKNGKPSYSGAPDRGLIPGRETHMYFFSLLLCPHRLWSKATRTWSCPLTPIYSGGYACAMLCLWHPLRLCGMVRN
jgi:hypothetical protein